MPRSQFTLRALLVAMLVVAAFMGGMATQRELSSLRATQRETELEKTNRGLKAHIQKLLYQREMVQKRRAEQMARDNPHLPQSQQFLPQPHPTK